VRVLHLDIYTGKRNGAYPFKRIFICDIEKEEEEEEDPISSAVINILNGVCNYMQ
jgi:hypothetical protein